MWMFVWVLIRLHGRAWIYLQLNVLLYIYVVPIVVHYSNFKSKNRACKIAIIILLGTLILLQHWAISLISKNTVITKHQETITKPLQLVHNDNKENSPTKKYTNFHLPKIGLKLLIRPKQSCNHESLSTCAINFINPTNKPFSWILKLEIE